MMIRLRMHHWLKYEVNTMGLFDKLFGKKEPEKKAESTTVISNAQPTMPTEKLMTSQFPALYLKENKLVYRDIYLRQLMRIGFNQKNAEKMFEFECDIIRRHGKQYLQHPQFTELWFFGLRQPFFLQYPKSKEDILKEKYLTMSEICKIVDEAEWHYWNSHERNLSSEVWEEICEWRLKGPGIEFASTYFEMIEKETGIPTENIGNLCALQGEHLNRYKW